MNNQERKNSLNCTTISLISWCIIFTYVIFACVSYIVAVLYAEVFQALISLLTEFSHKCLILHFIEYPRISKFLRRFLFHDPLQGQPFYCCSVLAYPFQLPPATTACCHDVVAHTGHACLPLLPQASLT